MQRNFQESARMMLSDFGIEHQMTAHPIRESGNGTEWQNRLSKTIHTVYHAILDDQNFGSVATESALHPNATSLMIHVKQRKASEGDAQRAVTYPLNYS